MQTSFLGDQPVGRIGFGAMQLAGPGVFGPPRDLDAARAVLRRAVELGVDHIDTAQFYGPDVVNDLIRDTLHPYPEGLRLVSKVGARRDRSGGWLPAQSPPELRRGVEDNLRSLKVDRLALVNLRLHSETGEPAEPREDQLAEMVALRDEGKIGQIGVSNVSLAGARLAMDATTIGQVQNSYSIIDRGDEPLLDLCREQAVAFVPFFPLGSAFTGGPATLAGDPVIASVAAAHGATASQIALAWLLQRYDRLLLIPGTTSVAHLEENLGADAIELAPEEVAALDGVEQVGRPHR